MYWGTSSSPFMWTHHPLPPPLLLPQSMLCIKKWHWNNSCSQSPWQIAVFLLPPFTFLSSWWVLGVWTFTFLVNYWFFLIAYRGGVWWYLKLWFLGPFSISKEFLRGKNRDRGNSLFLKESIGQIRLLLNSVAQLTKLVLRGSSGPGDDETSDYTAHYVKEKLNQMQLLLYNSKTELSVFLNEF